MIEINVDEFNTMSDGSARTIKNQYQKNSVANFTSQGDRGASAVAYKIDNSPLRLGYCDRYDDGKPHQSTTFYDISKLSPTLDTCGGGNTEVKVAIPVLAPDRFEKRQNGRRFKENGEPMFTLTSVDRHGVGIDVIGNYSPSEHDASRIIDKNGIAPTVRENHGTVTAIAEPIEIDKSNEQGIFVKISDKLTVYAVWYEKYQCYIAIRKLTPKECFRLQGWSDDYFEKAEFVNSNSQLYKQAGNGVTVDVIKSIGDKIAESEG